MWEIMDWYYTSLFVVKLRFSIIIIFVSLFKPLYDRIFKLRKFNPKLKILISIGGWFAKSTPFNTILTSDTTRNTFIDNALNFLRHWQFDGLGLFYYYLEIEIQSNILQDSIIYDFLL